MDGPDSGVPGPAEPLARYRAALERDRLLADDLERRARTVEIGRLLSFVVLVLAWALHDETPLPPALLLSCAGISLLVFLVLVVRHRALRREVRRARVSESLARLGVLRLTRSWTGIVEEMEKLGHPDPMLVAMSPDGGHPYAYDLDVFGPASVRALLGPTPTVTGRRMLEDWLHTPAEPDEIRRRQSAVLDLAADLERRERLVGEGLMIERVDRDDWEGFLKWLEGPPIFPTDSEGAEPALLPGWSRVVAWIAPLTTGSLFTYWFVSVGVTPLIWLAPLAMQVLLANLWGKAAYRGFAGAEARVRSLKSHHGLFAAWESLELDEPTLLSLRGHLIDGSGVRASEEIRSLGRWLDLAASAGSMVHGIVAALLLWDVHVANGLHRWRLRAGDSVRGWFEAVGELEALSALATLAGDQPGWSMPEVEEGIPGLAADELGHPLLGDDERQTSDVSLDPPGRFLLVTGSNMSGKSTLLRSIGLAAVMGQAGSVVCARSARLTPLRVFTSMRIHDSLTGGVSLFMAELLRLKALVDAADQTERRPLLYLIDEVLQGTNSEERRVAARRIIRHLLSVPAIGAVTTHDLALHEDPALDGASTKVHFREEVGVSEEDVLTFDYKLRPGLATSRNALKLLKLVGLDEG